MKYPCNLVQDLLPLYHDGVCSEESRSIIENHLSECMACKEYHTSLCEADKMVTEPLTTDRELKKAASFQAVKKRLLRKQILVSLISFAMLAMVVFAVISVLKSSVNVIEYRDNISVSMTDDCLIGRLQSNQASSFKVRRVEMMAGGKMNTCLFFCMSGTKWDDITTGDNVFSEYVLCSADKGAAKIDAVYYYIGEYVGIENMSHEELQKVIDASVLLWSK